MERVLPAFGGVSVLLHRISRSHSHPVKFCVPPDYMETLYEDPGLTRDWKTNCRDARHLDRAWSLDCRCNLVADASGGSRSTWC